MSEHDKIKRAEYQQKRKKMITILAAVILALTVITASFSAIYIDLDANTYVYYSENCSAVYHAYLNENEYYEQERLNGEHAYISTLIHHMDVQFCYESKMDAEDVKYQYQYRVDTQFVIQDDKTGAAIYNPTETILGPTIAVCEGQQLVLKPTVEIDYVSYNEKAKTFIEQYRLTNVTAHLNVTMYVDVVGMSELFATDNEGQYNISVKIPLNQNVFKPQITSTIPDGSQKVLSNPNEVKRVIRIIAMVAGILDAVAIAGSAYYVLKTRDEHIDYSRKVQRIVSNYKSFIQKINNGFDASGYQVLKVDTFNEMLEIRDTLQLPILMHENEDKTRTVFCIPVDGKLLYTFEIKVDNFEKIYAAAADQK